MSESSATFYADLLAEAVLPARGIHSQTLSKADGVELVVFAFAAGEALSEHTSSRPAIIHVLAGEGDLTVEDEVHAARPGTWVRMPIPVSAQHHGADATRDGALPAADRELQLRRLTVETWTALQSHRGPLPNQQCGSGGRIRTTDQGLMSPLLYH
jgi:quercetin dioxygenase-like cupin family protein